MQVITEKYRDENLRLSFEMQALGWYDEEHGVSIRVTQARSISEKGGQLFFESLEEFPTRVKEALLQKAYAHVRNTSLLGRKVTFTQDLVFNNVEYEAGTEFLVSNAGTDYVYIVGLDDAETEIVILPPDFSDDEFIIIRDEMEADPGIEIERIRLTDSDAYISITEDWGNFS